MRRYTVAAKITVDGSAADIIEGLGATDVVDGGAAGFLGGVLERIFGGGGL